MLDTEAMAKGCDKPPKSLTSSLSRSRVCTERRMQAKITTTIDNICTAARIEFARKGFSDARLENVARAAGVAKQLIEHSFKYKDELYGVLLEDVARYTLSYLADSSSDGLRQDQKTVVSGKSVYV